MFERFILACYFLLAVGLIAAMIGMWLNDPDET